MGKPQRSKWCQIPVKQKPVFRRTVSGSPRNRPQTRLAMLTTSRTKKLLFLTQELTKYGRLIKARIIIQGLNWPPPVKGDTKHTPKMQGTVWLLYTRS